MGATIDTVGKLQKLMRDYPAHRAIDYDPEMEEFYVKVDATVFGERIGRGSRDVEGSGNGKASTLISALRFALNDLEEHIKSTSG